MLTDRMADHAAMQAYLEDLSGDNSAWRAAFRKAFFRAMRDALTARQYEALQLHCRTLGRFTIRGVPPSCARQKTPAAFADI